MTFGATVREFVADTNSGASCPFTAVVTIKDLVPAPEVTTFDLRFASPLLTEQAMMGLAVLVERVIREKVPAAFDTNAPFAVCPITEIGDIELSVDHEATPADTVERHFDEFQEEGFLSSQAKTHLMAAWDSLAPILDFGMLARLRREVDTDSNDPTIAQTLGVDACLPGQELDASTQRCVASKAIRVGMAMLPEDITRHIEFTGDAERSSAPEVRMPFAVPVYLEIARAPRTIEISDDDEVNIVYVADGPVTVFGSSGYNAIIADDSPTVSASEGAIYGGPGNDLLLTSVLPAFGGFGDDVIFGHEGPQYLVGGAGRDNIRGFQGDDTIYGGLGDDVLSGDAGDDILFPGSGKDFVRCGSGNDVVTTTAGEDKIYGDDGDDTVILIGNGHVIFYGGNGADTIVVNSYFSGTYEVYGESGADSWPANDSDSFEVSGDAITITTTHGTIYADTADLYDGQPITSSQKYLDATQ